MYEGEVPHKIGGGGARQCRPKGSPSGAQLWPRPASLHPLCPHEDSDAYYLPRASRTFIQAPAM